MSTLKADTIVASDGTSPVTLTKQEGVKAYLVYDFSDDGKPDSFNSSSVTDRTTGSLYGNYTNNMALAGHAVTCAVSSVQEGSMATTSDNRYGIASGDTTARFSANYYLVGTQTSASNVPYCSSLVVGDLA